MVYSGNVRVIVPGISSNNTGTQAYSYKFTLLSGVMWLFASKPRLDGLPVPAVTLCCQRFP